MYAILHRGVLLLYCMLSFTAAAPSNASILAFFTAVIFSCALFHAAGKMLQDLLLFACGLWFLRCPEAVCFAPLIACDCFPLPLRKQNGQTPNHTAKPYRFALAARLFACLGICFAARSFRTFAFLAVGCLIAALLCTQGDALLALQNRYKKTRDDDTELQLLLKERNRSLLEKQNNEIYTATLRERNRIAREIHDNLGHMLTRSILMVGALRTVQKDPSVSAALAQLEETLAEAMDSIRKSVHDLHDQSVNLQESLHTLLRDFTFCPVTLQYHMPQELPYELKYSLIAITREGLVNIARHSRATSASLSVIEHPGFYQYILADNGTGLFDETGQAFGDSPDKIKQAFDGSPNEIKQAPGGSPNETGQAPGGSPGRGGIGLSSIESRVRSLHGSVQFHTGNGFRIHISIPKF